LQIDVPQSDVRRRAFIRADRYESIKSVDSATSARKTNRTLRVRRKIVESLGVKISSLGPVRAEPIKKGMIRSPAYGEMAFTMLLFNEFMIRAIPPLHP
jgi:hypothetical protein